MHSAYVVVEFSNDGLPERPAVAISAFVVEGGRGAVQLPEGSDAREVFLGFRLSFKEEREWQVHIVVTAMGL